MKRKKIGGKLLLITVEIKVNCFQRLVRKGKRLFDFFTWNKV